MNNDQRRAIRPLINDKEAAFLVGIAVKTWWKLNSSKEVPAAIKIGGSTRWRQAELLAWIDAGCPRREHWEKIWSALN